MRPAQSYDDFLARPLGRYVIERQFVAWSPSPRVLGFSLWGKPGADELDRLLRPLDLPRPLDLAPKSKILLDVRRVASIDFETFERLLAISRARRVDLERRISQQVVVRGGGIVGALAEGFAGLVAPRHGWRVVDSMAAAVAWLEEPALGDSLARLDHVVDLARGQQPIVAQLRAWFDSDRADLSIEEAARALRLPRRTLQRALASAGTSYREELERHVLERALRHLSETDEKIEAIARRLGFANVSSFGLFFRRVTGHAPGDARRRRARVIARATSSSAANDGEPRVAEQPPAMTSTRAG